MSRFSLEQALRLREAERIQWHKNYMNQYGIEKTKDLLVRELKKGQKLPKDMKLKEYVDYLENEIT